MLAEVYHHKGVLRKEVVNKISNYKQEDQNYINDEDAENAIIYGIECFRIKKDYNFYKNMICISPSTNKEINFINQVTGYVSEIKFNKIADINFEHLNNLADRLTKYDHKYYCQVLLPKKTYQFCFVDKRSLLLFIKGLRLISKRNAMNYFPQINIYTNHFNQYINDIINDDELKYFARCLGINFEHFKQKFENNNNIISSQELKNFIKKQLSGRQFQDTFEKYCTMENENKEKVMGPKDLQKFFIEFQKEEISYSEACQIIIQFNSFHGPEQKRKIIEYIEEYIVKDRNINESEILKIIEDQNNEVDSKNQKFNLRLYLTLYEFNMMVSSSLLIVYDKKKFDKPLDLDRPINEYFIKSTHNTYLTSHQLAGKSSIKMYSTSLLYNFRIVELDCYNGIGDNIIITHGYSFVTELELEDILYELKKTAFVYSDLPVILSIENHLDESHQIIMVNKLKSILQDLYIFPYDVIPSYIPTLRDMCNKFLVKCGGRKLWENDIIPKKNLVTISFMSNATSNPKRKNLKREIPHLQLIEKKIIILDRLSDYHMTVKNKTIKEFSVPKTYSLMEEKRTIDKLENVRGILSMKLIKDKIYSNYYKPWEMITLKSTKATKIPDDLNEKKDIIKVTQQCLIKVYPQSLDSKNYNMIKCFSCGIQACALNIQTTEDDFILYDKIFFKQSQGLGYVVKYDKFFSRNNIDTYEKPRYICHMEIVSLINCSILIENAGLSIDINKELSVTIYSIGVKEDESNPEVNSKLINGTMFPSFKDGNPVIDYKVYDYELSAIMIKIKYQNRMVGRGCIPYYLMKQGYRRIPIYDNKCFSVDDAYMVGYFSLKNIQNI